MTQVTEFVYSWKGDPIAEGLSQEGYKQIQLIVEAAQTKKKDITWPARVHVEWSTVDMAIADPSLRDNVGVVLKFIDEADGRLILELGFQFPKKGIAGISADAFVQKLMKV